MSDAILRQATRSTISMACLNGRGRLADDQLLWVDLHRGSQVDTADVTEVFDLHETTAGFLSHAPRAACVLRPRPLHPHHHVHAP